jgi:hypothetical protein
MATRAALEQKRSLGRERALLRLVVQILRRERWLRARHAEVLARVQVLDRRDDSAPPPWPEIVVPPEFVGLLDDEDKEG